MTAKLVQGVRRPRRTWRPTITTSCRRGEGNPSAAWRMATATRKLPGHPDLAESTVKIHIQNIFKPN